MVKGSKGVSPIASPPNLVPKTDKVSSSTPVFKRFCARNANPAFL
jgi:hypothetical protein